jgi:nucleoside 2-deoxyribosyltransferase
MLIRVYTSGTMQTNWRTSAESLFRERVHAVVAEKWLPERVPADYSRPRQDVDLLLNRVSWFHPRPPGIGGSRHSTTRAGFYIPRNLRLIHDCDLVLSCINQGFASIDSAHEVGVAYAWSKPIITVDLTGGVAEYAAWRAMSLVVLHTLEEAAEFLLYQVQDFDIRQETDELLSATNSVSITVESNNGG